MNDQYTSEEESKRANYDFYTRYYGMKNMLTVMEEKKSKDPNFDSFDTSKYSHYIEQLNQFLDNMQSNFCTETMKEEPKVINTNWFQWCLEGQTSIDAKGNTTATVLSSFVKSAVESANRYITNFNPMSSNGYTHVGISNNSPLCHVSLNFTLTPLQQPTATSYSQWFQLNASPTIQNKSKPSLVKILQGIHKNETHWISSQDLTEILKLQNTKPVQ